MEVNVHSIYFTFLNLVTFTANNILTKTVQEICPGYKKGPSLHVFDLVGNWVTAYIQPQTIECFAFSVRATTELEREQYVVKYSSFNNSVQWSECLLQVETPVGKHFLQGNGTLSGLLENIIIYEDKPGQYELQNSTADQWMVFGRRGSEVLITRDCSGESTAAFARAPYWPTFQELSALFHRSGTAIQTHTHMLCKPKGICDMESFEAPRRSNKNQKGNTQEVKGPQES